MGTFEQTREAFWKREQEKNMSCEHEFKEYVGFTDRYDYCVKCDHRKSDFTLTNTESPSSAMRVFCGLVTAARKKNPFLQLLKEKSEHYCEVSPLPAAPISSEETPDIPYHWFNSGVSIPVKTVEDPLKAADGRISYTGAVNNTDNRLANVFSELNMAQDERDSRVNFTGLTAWLPEAPPPNFWDHSYLDECVVISVDRQLGTVTLKLKNVKDHKHLEVGMKMDLLDFEDDCE